MELDKKIKGSWLIHHTNKLQGVNNQANYEKTYLSGKSGILLSAISADNQHFLTKEKVQVLAKAANINVLTELPVLLDKLKDHQLIEKSIYGIEVLGVTTTSTLQHTSDIFDALEPNKQEIASLTLAEQSSLAPIFVEDVEEELKDYFSLSDEEFNILLNDSEKIGFVDTEPIDSNKKLLFNGNLFRRETTAKIKKVLDTLTEVEQRNLNEVSEILKKSPCLNLDQAKHILGERLFLKITSIGLFDINIVSNSTEEVGFISLPSAFSKYSNSMIDDAFDLAKAFLSSITYGMTKSNYERGKIQLVEKLLSVLISGEPVGPVRAIAEDYKILEMKGVVKVEIGVKGNRRGPLLYLLKKEVGILALQAIKSGDVSEESLHSLPTAIITRYQGPELNREKIRRAQIDFNSKDTNDMLSILRTGGNL